MSSWNQPVAPCCIATLLQNHLKRCFWGLFLISGGFLVLQLSPCVYAGCQYLVEFKTFFLVETIASCRGGYSVLSVFRKSIHTNPATLGFKSLFPSTWRYPPWAGQNHHTWFSLLEQTLDKWKIYSTATFQRILKTHLQYLFTTDLTQSILYFVWKKICSFHVLLWIWAYWGYSSSTHLY